MLIVALLSSLGILADIVQFKLLSKTDFSILAIWLETWRRFHVPSHAISRTQPTASYLLWYVNNSIESAKKLVQSLAYDYAVYDCLSNCSSCLEHAPQVHATKISIAPEIRQRKQYQFFQSCHAVKHRMCSRFANKCVFRITC